MCEPRTNDYIWTQDEVNFIISDFLLPFIVYCALLLHFELKWYIKLLLIIGTMMGMLGWELPFYLLGLDFLYFVNKNQLVDSCWFFFHSLWDGLLFMIGYVLCYCFNYMFHDTYRTLSKHKLYELIILLFWYNLQELLVELKFNGIVWCYSPNHWYNPTMFVINGVHYTLLPQLVWSIYGVAFWIVCVFIIKHFTKKTHQEEEEKEEKEKKKYIIL